MGKPEEYNPRETAAVVSASGLVKHYGRVQALDGLNLEVWAGEVHGLLGPNGAGKSTTLRILSGLARAHAGTVRVLGQDPWRDAANVHRRIASVPGDVALWPNLTGGETIDLIARLRGARTGGDEYRTTRERLLSVFDLDPRRKGRSYSKGNRQKVALVAAFVMPADLYLLDEPTSGLDPLMEAVFRDEVRRVREQGAAVLLSSHILSEVEQLCRRVSIVRAGQVVDSGTLAELRHLSRTEVSFLAGDAGEPVFSGGLDVELEDLPDGRTRILTDADRVTELLPALAAARVSSLRVEPATLESVFMRHYSGT